MLVQCFILRQDVGLKFKLVFTYCNPQIDPSSSLCRGSRRTISNLERQIRNNCLNFFFYKLTCWNPVPSQPYCTGTAVLWVRSIFQVGGIWAAGVWLFIQTEHVGGMKSGSLLQVDGVLYPLHFFKMQWVYCLHLSLLYTYSEHDCLFGFLFIFPDTLNRIQTQICSSGCCLLDFLIVENYLIA